jgi:hypothetical protein
MIDNGKCKGWAANAGKKRAVAGETDRAPLSRSASSGVRDVSKLLQFHNLLQLSDLSLMYVP